MNKKMADTAKRQPNQDSCGNSKTKLPARLTGDAVLRPNWEWVDKFPDSKKIFRDIKAQNSVERARTALFMWEDGSFSTMKFFNGWPDVPLADDDAIRMAYGIGRAWLERMEREGD